MRVEKARKALIVIGGATATGKSLLACCVAKRLEGEIVSADSMAVYRDMDIGTAKPRECLSRVRHHLIDILEPGQYFDAKLFEELALKAIEDIWRRGKVPIVVGGSYLYIQALLYGIEPTPPPNHRLRERLYRLAEQKGRHFLYRKLRSVDPSYASKVHPNDLRRVVRALEVFIETGRPFSRFHRWDRERFPYLGVHVLRDPESLSARIEERVQKMLREGLLEEVKRLLDRGFENFLTSSQAIGYKELVPCLRGKRDLQSCVRDIVRNTKSYAKRQTRWFKKRNWLELNLDRMDPEQACKEVCKNFEPFLKIREHTK